MSVIALPSEETTSSLSTQKTQDPFPRPPIKSTGPRTEKGKKTSSQNARKHNLSATIPPPSLLANPTYQISKTEFQEEFNPQTPAQCLLVDQLTFIAWKLDQIPHLEHQLLATPMGQTHPTPIDQTSAADPADYVFSRLADDNAPPPPKDPTNQITATHLLQNQSTPLTRLWDYHRRLLARFQSLLRQIHQLKNRQQSAETAAERTESRHRQKDHDTLTECVNEIRQRNHDRDQAERRQRQKELDSPSIPAFPPPENTPAQNELPPQPEISNPKSEIPLVTPSVPPVLSVVNPPAPAQNELPRRLPLLLIALSLLLPTQKAHGTCSPPHPTVILPNSKSPMEHQLTTSPQNHLLTNTAVWSPDSQWIVYDTRTDPHGAIFDGHRIEQINIHTKEIRLLYQSRNNAHCAVATHSPTQNKIIFILGPEHPTPDWQYSPSHRQGVIVNTSQPNLAHNLDARDLTPPFTPGALRGGSHVHVFDPQGQLVSFTYNDALIHPDQRNIGISIPARPVTVPKTHPRNHDGDYFSVLVTQTTANPRPGSDEIRRAFEDAWVGNNGYIKPDATRQNRAIAFQGEVVTPAGHPISEVFIVDLPNDLATPASAPLQGAATRLPAPPAGVVQRRLTFTADRPFPGIQGPRHWLRTSPDGEHIAFLMCDDHGIAQLWTISPRGGPPIQLTRNAHPITSAFSWHPNGRAILHIMDESVCRTDSATGATHRIATQTASTDPPLPLACVVSPNGRQVAYLRRQNGFNQIFVATME